MNSTNKAIEMENHVFQKAQTREDYLSYVAKLIIHIQSKFISIIVHQYSQTKVKFYTPL